MKKVFAAALLVLALLLGACGAPNSGQSAVQTPGETQQSAETDTEGTENSPHSEATALADTAEAKRAPRIVISSAFDSRYDYDLNVSFGYGTVPLFYCGDRREIDDWEAVRDDENYPALAAALREYNEQSRQTLQENMDQIESAARGDYEYGNYPGAEDYRMVYRSESMAWLARADRNLVSFWVESYWSSGGAHPFTGYQGLNFDTETGKQLSINDLLTETGVERLPELFESALFEQYPLYREGLLVDSVSETIRQEMAEQALQFTVDADGVTFLISPYELASYANGPAFVHLSFADAPELFEARYASAGENWVSAMRPQNEDSWYSELNTTVLHTQTGDRTLSVQYIPDDYESGRMCSLTVTLDGHSWEAEEFFGYSVRPYLFHTEGKDYLFLGYELPSDWDALYVLDLNGEEPVLVDSRVEGFDAQIPTDPADFLLTTRSYCMSTYGITRSYTLDAAGKPLNTEELYTATYAPTLTLRQDLTVTELTSDGSESETTLSAGKKLQFLHTNNQDLVDLTDAKGKVYRVSYDHGEDYIGTVNGLPLTEVFDGTMFAG